MRCMPTCPSRTTRLWTWCPTRAPAHFGVAGIKLTPRHYAYLKISEGCNHRCTFCIIPVDAR
jgi:tRNA A37 methylthiotransferase MiaB